MKNKWLHTTGRFFLYPRYVLEFIGLLVIFVPAAILPFKVSSYLFGFIIANVGILLPQSNRIKNNLRLIYPLMEESFLKSLTKEIWFNVGRFAGETPHFLFRSWNGLKKFVEIKNFDAISNPISQGRNVIVVSAHIGNWWFYDKLFKDKNIPLYSIYREQNNPLIQFIVNRAYPDHKMAKGTTQMRKIIPAMQGSKNALSVLIDHRESRGMKAEFMGRPAMTSDFFAKLSIKYKVPVVHTICVRDKLNPTKFQLKCELIYDPLKDGIMTESQIVKMANEKLSQDVHSYREQWFWLHKRWKM